MKCETCRGTGLIITGRLLTDKGCQHIELECQKCGGTGKIAEPKEKARNDNIPGP